MDTIKLWARNGEAVRQAIELGELVHLDTASEELTEPCSSPDTRHVPWYAGGLTALPPASVCQR
jgi:hypothetical protein